MGSIISFVVLCICNMAVVRFCHELVIGHSCTLDDTPATVNGDDCAYRGPESFLPLWEDVAKVAGLIPSLGKVYRHQTYMNINSTSFEWSPSGFRLIPYVNMGLVVGNQRSTTDTSLAEAFLEGAQMDSRSTSIGSRHRTLIDNSPQRLQVAVHKAFLHFNKEVLSHFSGIPYFAPEECGGLGFRPILDVSTLSGEVSDIKFAYGPSPWEERAVEWLQENPSSRMVRRLPTDAPIQVRGVWTSLIPYRNRKNLGNANQYDMTEEDIGLLDVSAYYIVPSLVARALTKPGLPILRANQRAWKRLRARFNR
jgi:hypothetical protein